MAVSAGPGLLAPGPQGPAVAAGLSERAVSDRPLAAPLTICPRTTRSKSCAGHSLPSGKGLLERGASPLPQPGAQMPGSGRRVSVAGSPHRWPPASSRPAATWSASLLAAQGGGPGSRPVPGWGGHRRPQQTQAHGGVQAPAAPRRTHLRPRRPRRSDRTRRGNRSRTPGPAPAPSCRGRAALVRPPGARARPRSDAAPASCPLPCPSPASRPGPAPVPPGVSGFT